MTETIVVTTTKAAFLLNLVTRSARIIDAGRGVYYGVSFSREILYVACRQVEVGADRQSQSNKILCFDAKLRLIDVLESSPPLRDVHQILVYQDTLFACSTFDDMVAYYSLRERSWKIWHPFGTSDEPDRHHINSIGCDGAGLLLAGNKPTGWVARFTDNLVLVDGSHHSLGVGTHNVWSEDGDLHVCSSDEGALRSMSGLTVQVAQRGWVRGFARGPFYRYVGVSQNLVRGIRERSDSMVLRIDAAGEVVATYAFQGFGMVHDIRVLGVADSSHNGIVFCPDLSTWSSRSGDYQTSSTPISLALIDGS